MTPAIKIATLNTWHGLNPTGLFKFSYLNTPAAKALRIKDQINILAKMNLDIVALQELNPVFELGQSFVQKLGMQGLYCPDNTGIKLGPLKIPKNLFSGHALLISPDFKIIRLQTVQLSGFSGPLESLSIYMRINECRSLQLAEVENLEGLRLVLAGQHLHHGMEAYPELIAEFCRMNQSIQMQNKFLARLNAGAVRREQEIKSAIEALKIFNPQGLPEVLLGDFNSRPSSRPIEWLTRQGFIDSFKSVHANSAVDDSFGSTWNPEENPLNFKSFLQFKLPLNVKGLGLSTKQKTKIMDLAYQLELRPRRIDYVFYRQAAPRLEPVDSKLFATKPIHNKACPSDHFGLVSEFKILTE